MNRKISIIVSSEHNYLIGNKIHEIDKFTLQSYNKELSKFNLTFQQALVLLNISESKTDIHQKDLEEKMGLSNPSVTSLIKTMISKDLVYRIKSKLDARYFSLHLTPKSINMIEEIADTIFETNEKIMSSLSLEEQALLLKLLNKLSTGVN